MVFCWVVWSLTHVINYISNLLVLYIEWFTLVSYLICSVWLVTNKSNENKRKLKRLGQNSRG